MTRFSDRHGFQPEAAKISVRQDAPRALREALPLIARECGMRPASLRDVVCRVIRRLPDRNNWTEYPNVWQEAVGHIIGCPWPNVYDIGEAIVDWMQNHDPSKANIFQDEINKTFLLNGIGWQMIDELIVAREPEEIENVVHAAEESLTASESATALSELKEARADLSRRPEPDLTGCLHHCMASLECLCRELTDQPNLTLGNIVKHHGDKLGIVKPLGQMLAKAWGFVSDVARHVREGRAPVRKEATLVLGIVSSTISYLLAEERDGA